MRIMGIDYGDARVGIALSDPLMLTAQGFKTLPNKVYHKMIEALVELINDNDVCKIVIGMPKNLNGTLGFRADITNDFASDLKSRISDDIEIVFQDERLTTVEASTFLNFTDTRGKNRKNVIDTVAAEIILQSYLDSKVNKK